MDCGSRPSPRVRLSRPTP